jgi:hypothetical protein
MADKTVQKKYTSLTTEWKFPSEKLVETGNLCVKDLLDISGEAGRGFSVFKIGCFENVTHSG